MLAAGYNWWLPLDISSHGREIDHLIWMVHWFMAVLFVGWGGFFVYCLVCFRSRAGHQAATTLPKAKPSKYTEVAVVVIEAVLLLGFSVPIWARVRGAGHMPDPDQALQVRVIAEQFVWNIHYPGRDGIFGKSYPHRMNSDNPAGLDRSEPQAKDDIVTINQLHVPVDKQVLVHLTSKDVIHNFNLNYLRIKQDAIPGLRIPVWFMATATTDDVRRQMTQTYPTTTDSVSVLRYQVAMSEYKGADGDVIAAEGDLIDEQTLASLAAAGVDQVEAAPYVPTEIACAQLCGLGHYRMRGYLQIDTPEQFEQWMASEEQRLSEEGEEEY